MSVDSSSSAASASNLCSASSAASSEHPVPSWPVSSSEVWGRLLPELGHSRAIRFWLRLFLWMGRGRILKVHGLEHILSSNDPFILAVNHSQRWEALLLPAFLAFCRRGRLVHFFTDWLVLLYPVIGRIVLLHGPIIVTRKQAKLRILNFLRKRYEDPVPPFERARMVLARGGTVGIFPEGIMNRDRTRLLRGYSGAAQLSLSSGVSVVPVGIRFPHGSTQKPIGDLERMEIEFGAPMRPPEHSTGTEGEVAKIRDWHAQIMQALSRLSGKQWAPENQRTTYVA